MTEIEKAYLSILLLEDNAADAERVSEYLELSGLNCRIVAAGQLVEGLRPS